MGWNGWIDGFIVFPPSFHPMRMGNYCWFLPGGGARRGSGNVKVGGLGKMVDKKENRDWGEWEEVCMGDVTGDK